MEESKLEALAIETGAEKRDGGFWFDPTTLHYFYQNVYEAGRRDERAKLVHPSEAIIEAGCEVLYGHPREKAVEWVKEDKFDGYKNTVEELCSAFARINNDR